MLKNKIVAASHIALPHARKASPWVGIAAMFLVAATDLKKTK